MLNVCLLKQELQEYVQARGIKYKYIAQKIEVSESMLSHFKAGRKNLSTDKLMRLQQIIKNN